MPHPLDPPGDDTVLAARAGDPAACDRLIAGYLPLIYNIVGRALDGHADVDDVVQETMLRAVRGLPALRDPSRFRSWLVAIAIRQVRERHRAGVSAPTGAVPMDQLPEPDPGADFADLAIARLELSGQRRDVAEASRWLNADDRELLSLWWLEAAGELTRDEVADAVGGERAHVAVRIQRTKAQLETARVVVRALRHRPPCPDLLLLTAGWDGRPSPLWRKRLARHTRECGLCSAGWAGLVPADQLLVGMALVPVPVALLGHVVGPVADGVSVAAGAGSASGSALGAADLGVTVVRGAYRAAKATSFWSSKPLVAAATAVALTGGGATVALWPDAPATATSSVVAAPQPTPAATPAPSASPSPTPAVTPSATPTPTPSPAVTPTPSPTLTPEPPPEPPRAEPASVVSTDKKGVSTWEWPDVPAALEDVGASWFYNWSASDDRMPAPDGVEFVPMIWGEKSVTADTLETARREGEVLLGFNEPDLGEQASMSVDRALELWPELEATGLRLGSPAVAWGADQQGEWLDRFMTGAEERGLRVDFITLHWYGSDFGPDAVDHLENYIEATHDRYGLPIWVTEYGLINFGGSPKYPSDDQLVAFVEGSTAMMESLPYVERYAWFGLPAEEPGIGLYTDGSTPTAAGSAYRGAG